MKSFWSEPYLWIHAAGVAAVPLCLGLCLIGFAVGDPVLPVGLEILLVAIAGALPVLAMQWFRPFNIFSILLVSLKPELLNENQRRILRLFKTPTLRILAVFVPFVLTALLWQIYFLSPIAATVAPFPPSWRILGLIVAALGFFASNLFVQVPVAVLRVLLTSESGFAATEPYPLEKIRSDFTSPGLQVRQILPPIAPQS